MKKKIPNHVAIIMDGNRRWAKKRGLSIYKGHEAGVDALDEFLNHAQKIGIKVVTTYAFSSENWKRPKVEVHHLLGLILEYVAKKREELIEKKVYFHPIGDLTRFPVQIRKSAEELSRVTKPGSKFVFNAALSYGGRDEIVRAVRAYGASKSLGRINEKSLGDFMDTAGLPDPDLVIRTGGEKRLSGFLPWQCVYSELLFMDVLWPDFKPRDLDAALREFANRERRFGK